MNIKLLVVYIFEFLRDGLYVGLFLLVPFIVKELHLNLFQAGILQSGINLLLVGLAIPLTYLLIRFGEFSLLLLSLLLYSACFFAISFAYSYTYIFIFFLIIGVGFAVYSIISSHIRITWFDKETRGKELGHLMAVGDIGKTLFAISTGFIIGMIGWRITSFLIGLFAGSIFILVAFLLTRDHKQQVKPSQTTTYESSNTHLPFRYFLSHKPFLLALITNFLDDAANTPFYAFLPFLLLYKGVPTMWLGIFAAFYYVGNIVSRLIFGRLVDRVGNAKVLIVLELVMAATIFFLVNSPTLFITGILAVCLGFITEGTDPSTASMVAQSLEHVENPQKASGIRMVLNGTGRTIFPFFLGLIANTFGIAWGFYMLAFLCLLPIIPAWIFTQMEKK